MKLNKKIAKEISIIIWSYLCDHPEIGNKTALPKHLYAKIEHMANKCPLCELYIEGGCFGCPLDNVNGCKSYLEWERSFDPLSRKEYASAILSAIIEW